MNGQLYQECEKHSCHTEPVCVNCMYCETHCDCPSVAEVQEIEQRRKVKQEINRGYRLIENYIKEFGERTKNPSGKKVADTRYYHVGAGYGPGSVFSIEENGNIYLTVHTGSKVAEWASHSYVLPKVADSADDDNYTNASIILALVDLAKEQPLTNEQRRAFEI